MGITLGTTVFAVFPDGLETFVGSDVILKVSIGLTSVFLVILVILYFGLDVLTLLQSREDVLVLLLLEVLVEEDALDGLKEYFTFLEGDCFLLESEGGRGLEVTGDPGVS